MRSWRQVGKMLHRQTVTGIALLYRVHLRVKVRRERKSAGPWRVGYRAENESLPQEHRGGRVVVGLFIGKFCLPIPSPLPVCLSENVCSEHGYFVSRRFEEESGVIGVG